MFCWPIVFISENVYSIIPKLTLHHCSNILYSIYSTIHSRPKSRCTVIECPSGSGHTTFLMERGGGPGFS